MKKPGQVDFGALASTTNLQRIYKRSQFRFFRFADRRDTSVLGATTNKKTDRGDGPDRSQFNASHFANTGNGDGAQE
jgi:hypothetical protein